MEDNKDNETEVIKAIKEEYEKKIADIKKELETKHIEQIRALLSGREEVATKEIEKETEEEQENNKIQESIKKILKRRGIK